MEYDELVEKVIKMERQFETLIKSDRYTFQKDLELLNGRNLITSTDTGTKIGTETGQKIGFYNTTPVVQATTSGDEADFTTNSGTAVNDNSTFDGYTIRQVVRALKNLGLIA